MCYSLEDTWYMVSIIFRRKQEVVLALVGACSVFRTTPGIGQAARDFHTISMSGTLPVR